MERQDKKRKQGKEKRKKDVILADPLVGTD